MLFTVFKRFFIGPIGSPAQRASRTGKPTSRRSDLLAVFKTLVKACKIEFFFLKLKLKQQKSTSIYINQKNCFFFNPSFLFILTFSLLTSFF